MENGALPTGREDAIWDAYLPDMRTTVELFAMHIRSVRPDWNYPSHEHLHYEINYVAAGVQAMTTNGTRYSQQAGDILLIPPGTPHFSSVSDGADMTYLCLHFIVEDQFFMPLLSHVQEVFHPKDSPFAQLIGEELRRLVDVMGRGYDAARSTQQTLLTQSLVLRLIGKMAEYLSTQDDCCQQDRTQQLARKIESLILASLNAVTVHGTQIDHRAQINTIAEKLGIHPSYCSRVFRKVYGVSPRQYLTDLVVTHAKTMLGQLELPIDNIATLLGYADTSHFSRQFKRWTGQSPLQYRRILVNLQGTFDNPPTSTHIVHR